MQVQLDLDLFTGGTDLVVPMQYYSAKYFDDKGLMKKSFAVSVDSRNELRKGALIKNSTGRQAVISQPKLIPEIEAEYNGQLIHAESLNTMLEDYLVDKLGSSIEQVNLLDSYYKLQKKEQDDANK